MCVRIGERILGGSDHFSKEFARPVRFALKSGSHGKAIGCSLIIRVRREHAFKGRRSRGAVPCRNLPLPFG